MRYFLILVVLFAVSCSRENNIVDNTEEIIINHPEQDSLLFSVGTFVPFGQIGHPIYPDGGAIFLVYVFNPTNAQWHGYPEISAYEGGKPPNETTLIGKARGNLCRDVNPDWFYIEAEDTVDYIAPLIERMGHAYIYIDWSKYSSAYMYYRFISDGDAVQEKMFYVEKPRGNQWQILQ